MSRYKLYLLVALVISLGSCAVYPDTHRLRLESLPHKYSQFDAVLAWEIKGAGPETVIEGEFQNVRYDYMEDAEVWVAALDAAGKTLARSVGFLVPNQLRRGETAPFNVRLPVAALPGTRLRFTYKYRGQSGGADGGVGNWMQSFDAAIPER